MYRVRLGIAALCTLPASSAMAASCFFSGGHAYCDAGCRITRRWWDAHGREWINYSCASWPPPDPMPFIALLVVAVVVFVLFLGSIMSSTPTEDEAAIDAEIAKTKEITDKLDAAAREADAHIAAVLENIRKDHRNG